MADTITCSRNQLASALDVTPKHIDNLFNAGIVVKQARGEYDIIASCKNYIEFVRGSQSAEKLDLTQERTRLTKYQADLTHLQLQQARGEYLPLDLFKMWFQSMMSAVKSKLLALPSAMGAEMGIDRDTVLKIDERIREVLSDTAKTPMPSELQARLKAHFKEFQSKT